jgi:SAM-dependent methyltransferase
MRTICPVCGSFKRVPVDWELEFVVPDGWELPETSKVICCAQCGVIFYDNNKTQMDYDHYYIKRYGYGLEGPDIDARMAGAAEFIAKNFTKDISIVDYGGGNGDLMRALQKVGFRNVTNYTLGDNLGSNKYDLLICSHILEHIYDVQYFMKQVVDFVKPNGYIYLDMPYYDDYEAYDSPLMDMHQKHINHFWIKHIDSLMFNHGFELSDFEFYKERGCPLLRRLYKKYDITGNFLNIKKMFDKRMRELIDKVKEVKQPVIVWGLGDLAWYVLAHTQLDIVYFVDNDPAYRGQTLLGKEIKEKPDSDEPILIIVFAQKEPLLKNIKSLCDNEIIIP